MNVKFAAVIAGIGLVVVATPVVAHHSFAAEYDAARPVVLKGVVTRIEWTNPHAHCFVETKDDTGSVTNWKLELASPNVLVQLGWRANSLKVGDDVAIEGAMAKVTWTSVRLGGSFSDRHSIRQTAKLRPARGIGRSVAMLRLSDLRGTTLQPVRSA